MPRLYMVHCGFYDNGIFESHINLFVVAADFKSAKEKVKKNPQYIEKSMHVDGMVEIAAVDGYRLKLEEDKALKGDSIVKHSRH